MLFKSSWVHVTLLECSFIFIFLTDNIKLHYKTSMSINQIYYWGI